MIQRGNLQCRRKNTSIYTFLRTKSLFFSLLGFFPKLVAMLAPYLKFIYETKIIHWGATLTGTKCMNKTPNSKLLHFNFFDELKIKNSNMRFMLWNYPFKMILWVHFSVKLQNDGSRNPTTCKTRKSCSFHLKCVRLPWSMLFTHFCTIYKEISRRFSPNKILFQIKNVCHKI